MLKDEIKNIKSTNSDLRSFGLTVGTVFSLLGGVLLWAGKGAAPYLLGIGGVLVVSGMLFSWALKPVQKVWMTAALLIGWVMTRVLLSVFFYLVLTPISLLGRICGKRFLDIGARSASSYWHEREPINDLRTHYERQF